MIYNVYTCINIKIINKIRAILLISFINQLNIIDFEIPITI